MTGAAKNTVAKLLCDAGRACSEYQDKAFVNLPCKRIQCDEIWSYIGAKDKNATNEKKAEGWGDEWTWTAICADTKLVPCWFVSTRERGGSLPFYSRSADRLANRIQLTTDGHKAYLSVVEDAFGCDRLCNADQIYGNTPEGGEVRYSPRNAWEPRKLTSQAGPTINTFPQALQSTRI